MDRYNVVCYFAREHGLEGLRALIAQKKSPEIKRYFAPTYLFTHRLNPKSQDPSRGEREDFYSFKKLAEDNGIPVYSVDSKEEEETSYDILTQIGRIDLLASISWRRLIPAPVLKLPKYGGVNLHRGKLPEYAGAEPLKKALQRGERKVFITAHVLDEKIDSGEIIAVRNHPVNYDQSRTLDENVERLKQEITPYFGGLLLESLDSMIGKNGQ